MLIYKATNKVNGKEYVGQTVGSLNKRRSAHISAALVTKEGTYFYNAIRKYGSDGFEWKVVHRCNTIGELNTLETHYIKKYDTFDNGYNSTFGGDNRRLSDETKRKISEGNKGKKHSKKTKERLSEINKGKKLSNETKKKMSEANKKRRHSEETKKKIAESLRGNVCSEEKKRKISIANTGKRHSKETRKKLSDIRKGKKRIAKLPVIIDNKYFDTIKGAAKRLGVTPVTVRARIKRQFKGYQYA